MGEGESVHDLGPTEARIASDESFDSDASTVPSPETADGYTCAFDDVLPGAVDGDVRVANENLCSAHAATASGVRRKDVKQRMRAFRHWANGSMHHPVQQVADVVSRHEAEGARRKVFA